MKRAFTLIELSIVLIIIGLLVGGVLAGRDLIAQAQLAAVSTEIRQYQAALSTFDLKYDGLPGDLDNATDYWGLEAAGATCKTQASDTIETCDGDGNRRIENSPANSNELFRAWQHLANAGLAEGTFTGVQGSGGVNHGVIGQNVPSGPITGSGYGLQYNDANGLGVDYPFEGNRLWFGAGVGANQTFGALLTTTDTYKLDLKMDDGIPGKGRFMTWDTGALTNCATTDDEDTAVYNLDYTDPACAFFYILD